MSAYGSDAPAPRSCQARDLAALIGLLAVLEGELMVGQVPQYLAEHIGGRLQDDLLMPIGTERDLRQTINDLNHRLRYALGEYEEPPSPREVPE
jgi:hypothetical protein